MAGKIKAIIKKPGEPYGHMTHISPSLENLQKHVDGLIQVANIGDGLLTRHLVAICNEEGRIRGLPMNFYSCSWLHSNWFVGTVIICGQGEEDFTDIPIDFKTWKALLKAWGN